MTPNDRERCRSALLSDDIIIEKARISLTSTDLGRLKSSEWLNDEVLLLSCSSFVIF